MRHALRVGLGKADSHVVREMEPVHRAVASQRRVRVTVLAELIRSASRASCSPAPASRPRAASPTSARRPGSGRRSTRWSTRTIDAFRRGSGEGLEFYALRLEMLTGPSRMTAHRALAELERRGFVTAIITQNIDVLHAARRERASVVEVHGSIRPRPASRCGHRVPLEEVVALLDGPAPPLPGAAAPCSSRTSSCSASCCRLRRSTVPTSSPAGRADARRGLRARGPPGGRAPAGDRARRRVARDRQPRPDRARRPGASSRSTPRPAKRCARSLSALAVAPAEPQTSAAPNALWPLGRSAPERPLVKHPAAGRADLALDLVRDTCALPEHVRRDGGVAV